MKWQSNLAVPQYQKLAAVKPNSIIKNSSILGVPAPSRAGPAPQMRLDKWLPPAELPVVGKWGDTDSLKAVENYLDD